MTLAIPQPWRMRAREAAMGGVVLIGLGGAVVAGYLAPHKPLYAVIVGLTVLAVGLAAHEPALVPLVALPFVLVVRRVGAASIDVSVSDVALFLAAWPALFFGKRPYSRVMRGLLWLTVFFLITSSFTLLVNPYRANFVEFAHQVTLVLGALLIGWTLGRHGYARLAVGVLMVCLLLLALDTIYAGGRQVLRGDFSPVYLAWPWGMHKNFTGCVLAFLAVLAYARPDWARMPAWFMRTAFWSAALALGFTQSRQAIVGLVVALFVLVARSKSAHRRSRLVLLAGIPALVGVATVVREQTRSSNIHNSVFQRLTWLQDSITIWQSDPLFGAGNRWWYTDRFPFAFQPPNAFVEVLTEVGLVGLIGFIVLTVGSFLTIRLLPPPFAVVGLAVLAARLAQSQFDLFWVATISSIVWLILGLCAGAAAYDEELRTDDTREKLDRVFHAVGR